MEGPHWNFSGLISSTPRMLTLTEASANDPLLEIVAPDPAQRSKVAPWFFGFPVSYGLRYGRVWANEDASAVAVWIHPESGSMSMPKLLRAGMWQMPLKLGMGGMSRFSKAMAVTEPFHKQVEGPHWYLMNLGTRTARQGRGAWLAARRDGNVTGGSGRSALLPRDRDGGKRCLLQEARVRDPRPG